MPYLAWERRVYRVRRRSMSGLDLMICMDAADSLSPNRRGDLWLRTFFNAARRLGYVFDAASPCDCNGGRVCRPECGLVKPRPTLVFSFPKRFSDG